MTDTIISSYQPSEATKHLVAATPIVLLVGISGAGKDSVKKLLLQTGNYHHIISHTSRAPRVNSGILERDGHDYHFADRDAMLRMARGGEFVEIKEYSGNLYGTSAAEIQQASDETKIAITDLEIQGVAEYKAIAPHVIALFILPPDYEEWQRRLYARYGLDEADPIDIQKRMDTAVIELEEALSQPYYHFIINTDLHKAVETAAKIAGGDDSFNKIDDSVRRQAETLLLNIRQNSTNTIKV